MSERSMVQSWKGCVGAIPPGVRIPLSPNFASTSIEASFGKPNKRSSECTVVLTKVYPENFAKASFGEPNICR